jgi:tetratricopeptide (TPR) repeat protein
VGLQNGGEIMVARSYAYNTRKKTPEQLEKELVGSERWNILNSILNELALKKGEHPKQHWMIIGPRGIGKSHLLTLLYYKIKNNSELTKQWITVLFPEELRMANDLAKFLERTVKEILLELEKEKSPIAEELRREIKKIREIRASERIEHLFTVLNWIHQTSGKYILLLFENLQKLLGKKISIIEQKKLRAFLQTHDNVLLIGSATTVFNALHDHKHPFYHFFHIRRLTDLNFDEMKILITNILADDNKQDIAGKVAKNEARMRAIYSFTGGNPRMAVFLSDIIKTEVPDEMIGFMDEILEDLTPYFEAILNDTPDYMEEIMNTLAIQEPAQSPKEIAGHLEMQQTTIRNYLKQMKDNGYVRVAFSKGKSNYYCLNEYLYRIWYQMRDSSHREETRWLMELLMMLYSPKAIMEEKSKLDKCDMHEISDDSYKKLIVKTADFMDRHPEYCRVIELCVDSTFGGQEGTDKKWLALKFKESNELIDNRQYDRAIRIYQEILKRSPKSESSYGNWGICLFMQKRYEEAIEKFKKAIEINPKSSNAYMYWGICSEKLGRYDEAIKTLKKSLIIAPTSGDALWHLGYCLIPSEQYDEAINNLKKVIEINPNSAAAYGVWGDCLRFKELYQEACEKYQKAIEVDPSYSHAYKNWGYALFEQKSYKEAEEKYKKALEVDPQLSNAYELWGRGLGEQGNYQGAIEKLKKALEIDPKSELAYSYWGRYLCDLKRYDEAIEKYKKILEINPNSEIAYGLWGDCLRNQKCYDEAIKKYKMALEIAPGSEDVIKCWAHCLIESERYNEAIKLIEDHTKTLDNCSVLLAYGESLFKLERYADALTQFEKLLNLNKICRKVFMMYALSLEKLGEKESALIAYIKHSNERSIDSHIDIEFRNSYEKYFVPILRSLKQDVYIKYFYASETVKFSKPQLGTFLIMLDKYDVVSEILKSIASEYIEKDGKEKYDFEVMVFAIKLSMWIKLTGDKLHEALRLIELYADYIKLLKTDKEKEEEVSSLILSLFKLQVHMSVKNESIHQILEHLKNTGIPFSNLFFKVWTCLSDPDSIDAQRYLSDKAIAELIEQVKKKDEPTESECGT